MQCAHVEDVGSALIVPILVQLYGLPATRHTIITNILRFTPSFPFQVRNSINDLGDDTRRSSACTSVDGMAVKRPMVH